MLAFEEQGKMASAWAAVDGERKIRSAYENEGNASDGECASNEEYQSSSESGDDQQPQEAGSKSTDEEHASPNQEEDLNSNHQSPLEEEAECQPAALATANAEEDSVQMEYDDMPDYRDEAIVSTLVAMLQSHAATWCSTPLQLQLAWGIRMPVHVLCLSRH